MMRCFLLGLLTLLLATAGNALAQAPIFGPAAPDPTPPLPQPGSYFDRSQPGSGLFLDLGPNGEMFAAVFTYDDRTEPTFYILQGVFEANTFEEWRSSGVLGRFRSAVFQSRGGQCLGCPFRSPTTRLVTALGEAVMEFQTARRAKLTIGPQVWLMDASENEAGITGLIPGRWLMLAREVTSIDGPALGGYRVSAEVVVEPTSSATFRISRGTGEFHLPPAGSRQYSVRCEASCQDFDRLRRDRDVDEELDEVYLWFDPATQQAGLEFASSQIDGTRLVSPLRPAFALFIGTREIQGSARRVRLGNFGLATDDYSASDIRFVRLPEEYGLCEDGDARACDF